MRFGSTGIHGRAVPTSSATSKSCSSPSAGGVVANVAKDGGFSWSTRRSAWKSMRVHTTSQRIAGMSSSPVSRSISGVPAGRNCRGTSAYAGEEYPSRPFDS